MSFSSSTPLQHELLRHFRARHFQQCYDLKLYVQIVKHDSTPLQPTATRRPRNVMIDGLPSFEGQVDAISVRTSGFLQFCESLGKLGLTPRIFSIGANFLLYGTLACELPLLSNSPAFSEPWIQLC